VGPTDNTIDKAAAACGLEVAALRREVDILREALGAAHTALDSLPTSEARDILDAALEATQAQQAGGYMVEARYRTDPYTWATTGPLVQDMETAEINARALANRWPLVEGTRIVKYE